MTSPLLEKSGHWTPYLVLALVVAALFLTGAPTGGAFSWPDSPRHALNGAFVLDLIAAAPFDDPVQFAYDYYSRYPALTILFYPPLYYFFLAPFYALFGVSQDSALIVGYLFYVAFAWGSYVFARYWLDRMGALGVALILAGSPEIAFWGRQVMLEVPAFAFLVWSAVCFVAHLRDRKIVFLYIAVALLVLALYTKISVAFVALPYLICLLARRGREVFLDKHSYIIAALALVGMGPLLAMTFGFGQANVQSAVGIADAEVSRSSIDGWIWYALEFPDQIGWPALLAAIAFLPLWLWRRSTGQAALRDAALLLLWFVVGYLFYSAIDLKEARHSVFILLPIALCGGLAFAYLLPQAKHVAGALTVVVGVVTLGITAMTRPVLFVDGYREVVDFVSERAPEHSNVLFSGYRDGSFIFGMRAHSDRPDVGIVRSDKLLLRISVRRELGVEQKQHSAEEIRDLIGRLGIHYVVAQPDFWTDLEAMQRLQDVLHSEAFEEIGRFDMQANYNAQEKQLVVYRNKGEVAQGPVDITNELPIIGRTISGSSQ